MSENQLTELLRAAGDASIFVGPPTQAIAMRTVQAHELIIKVTSELSDEQLSFRPAHIAPSATPSIAWHLWHVARWADLLQAGLPSMAAELELVLGPGRQIWEAEDLAARWGLSSASGYRESGMGLDDEASAGLRLPKKEILLDYSGRVFAMADRAVSAVNEELFQTPSTDLYEHTTSIGTAVMSHLVHVNRHLGMIEALKGMLGVQGTATL